MEIKYNNNNNNNTIYLKCNIVGQNSKIISIGHNSFQNIGAIYDIIIQFFYMKNDKTYFYVIKKI